MNRPHARIHPFDCQAAAIHSTRGIFCNRTLNLRTIRAIGYDMDYTLVHYNVERWEEQAYEATRLRLEREGWPVKGLTFDPQRIVRGLVLDLELGNIIKPNRFGYITRASHGTQMMDFNQMREVYARTLIDLSDRRYIFLNTLFSISEAWLFAQLVDLMDHGILTQVPTYETLYKTVRHAIDTTHMEGELKAEIMQHPELYVELDPDIPLALLDQKSAGKRLLLITNSEWFYTRFMMRYAFDRFLPKGMTWRDLFELVVVSARKPDFFSLRAPVFSVVDEENGLLQPYISKLQSGGVYLGGNAGLIESSLALSGEDILYVGDHIYGDVTVSKSTLRWRTALILRELEAELECVESARLQQEQINVMMETKEAMEAELSALKLDILRKEHHYGPITETPEAELRQRAKQLREELVALDNQISPLVAEDSERVNPYWGYLMRAGNDKSHLTRQVERHADIYMSRVSNFLFYTPFMYFRSPRGSMSHDMPTLEIPPSPHLTPRPPTLS